MPCCYLSTMQRHREMEQMLKALSFTTSSHLFSFSCHLFVLINLWIRLLYPLYQIVHPSLLYQVGMHNVCGTFPSKPNTNKYLFLGLKYNFLLSNSKLNVDEIDKNNTQVTLCQNHTHECYLHYLYAILEIIIFLFLWASKHEFSMHNSSVNNL